MYVELEYIKCEKVISISILFVARSTCSDDGINFREYIKNLKIS